jgi:hypothetical protein
MRKIKGLVLETGKDFVILLTPQGEYLRLSTGKRLFKVGTEVEVNQPPVWQGAWLKGIAAAIVLFLLSTLLLNTLANQPKAYLALDINPSLTLVLNYKGQVIRGEAHNGAGAEMLEASNVNGLGVLEAVQALLEESHRQNYLHSEDENHIFVSLAAPANYRLTTKELRAFISNTVTNLEVDTYLRIYRAEMEKGEDAMGRDVSLNAVLLGEKMREAGEVIPETPGPPATIRAFLRTFKPDFFFSDDEFIPGAGRDNRKPEQGGAPANPPANHDKDKPSNPNSQKSP